MKRLFHMLSVLFAVSPLVVGNAYEILPPWHQQALPKSDIHWGLTEGDLTLIQKEVLLALKNYQDAAAAYGSQSRVAHVAASDLEAAIQIYLSTHEKSQP
jgi:hypothetical protein